MLETMHENDLLDMLPVFPNAVHILGVIPFTLCSAERSFSVLHRLKTYLRSTMGNNVTVTSHLLTLKGHMPTLQSTMIWIVSLLFSAVKMAKTAIFNVFYELPFLITVSFARIVSLNMQAYVVASYDPHFFSTVSSKFGQLARIFWANSLPPPGEKLPVHAYGQSGNKSVNFQLLVKNGGKF